MGTGQGARHRGGAARAHLRAAAAAEPGPRPPHPRQEPQLLRHRHRAVLRHRGAAGEHHANKLIYLLTHCLLFIYLLLINIGNYISCSIHEDATQSFQYLTNPINISDFERSRRVFVD